ncbi:MAG: glycerophosphodiester phosphodiesterase family protein [Mesorhizobium sp.]
MEIDVQKTRDGVYVALHDSWLDRTTTCRGKLVDRTLAELAECHLRVGETGYVSSETVPTLKAILSAARGRVLVNIDNKLEFSELAGIVTEARALGMEEQLIVKQNLWSAATGTVGASAVELINWRREAGSLAGDGGALFRPMVRAEAVRGDWHMWVNTYAIVNKPAGFLAGGRGDQLAVQASSPDEVFGFWIEQGATIIQTDEPKAAIEWLATHGYRRAYDLPAVSALADLGG